MQSMQHPLRNPYATALIFAGRNKRKVLINYGREY